MLKKERTAQYTHKQTNKRRHGLSDWAKAASITDAQLEASIATDPDEAGTVIDWDSVSVELPKPKADLHMRVDSDVLEFFRKAGKGYQTRINAVLRSYVSRMRRSKRPSRA